jgi:hypothetical protein
MKTDTTYGAVCSANAKANAWNIFGEVCQSTWRKYTGLQLTHFSYPNHVMAAAYKGWCEAGAGSSDPPAGNENDNGDLSWMVYGMLNAAYAQADYCGACGAADACAVDEAAGQQQQTKLLQPGAKQPKPDDLLELMDEIDRSKAKEKAAAAAAGAKPGEDLGSLLETMSQHKAKSRAGRWSCW